MRRALAVALLVGLPRPRAYASALVKAALLQSPAARSQQRFALGELVGIDLARLILWRAQATLAWARLQLVLARRREEAALAEARVHERGGQHAEHGNGRGSA